MLTAFPAALRSLWGPVRVCVLFSDKNPLTSRLRDVLIITADATVSISRRSNDLTGRILFKRIVVLYFHDNVSQPTPAIVYTPADSM